MKRVFLNVVFLLMCLVSTFAQRNKMYDYIVHDEKLESAYMVVPVKVIDTDFQAHLLIPNSSLRAMYTFDYSEFGFQNKTITYKEYVKYMYKVLKRERILKLTKEQYRTLLFLGLKSNFFQPSNCNISPKVLDSLLDYHFEPFVDTTFFSGRIEKDSVGFPNNNVCLIYGMYRRHILLRGRDDTGLHSIKQY